MGMHGPFFLWWGMYGPIYVCVCVLSSNYMYPNWVPNFKKKCFDTYTVSTHAYMYILNNLGVPMLDNHIYMDQKVGLQTQLYF